MTCLGIAGTAQGQAFVNWESPHVHPLDITPDGKTLLAVNTADHHLEVFDISSGQPVRRASILVGLDPVSVRAKTNTEAWVVNMISDDVSIVDLPTRRVVRTLRVGDEPCDVAFAGTPQRAFVSVSQENRLKVFDATSYAQVADLLLEGEEPRALATDGVRVFTAIFESGSQTTILDHTAVSAANGPYGDQNPPPNPGTAFNPKIR